MKSNDPFFSIIMPVYNCEDYLMVSIQSILDQTYKNFEFLILDDSSTDKTHEIINDFEKKDKRIKKFKNKVNIGLTKSLNKLLKYCRGEFIVRLDADDYCLEDRLTNFIEFLKVNPTTKVYSTPAFLTNYELKIKKRYKIILQEIFLINQY